MEMKKLICFLPTILILSVCNGSSESKPGGQNEEKMLFDPATAPKTWEKMRNALNNKPEWLQEMYATMFSKFWNRETDSMQTEIFGNYRVCLPGWQDESVTAWEQVLTKTNAIHGGHLVKNSLIPSVHGCSYNIKPIIKNTRLTSAFIAAHGAGAYSQFFDNQRNESGDPEYDCFDTRTETPFRNYLKTLRTYGIPKKWSHETETFENYTREFRDSYPANVCRLVLCVTLNRPGLYKAVSDLKESHSHRRWFVSNFGKGARRVRNIHEHTVRSVIPLMVWEIPVSDICVKASKYNDIASMPWHQLGLPTNSFDMNLKYARIESTREDELTDVEDSDKSSSTKLSSSTPLMTQLGTAIIDEKTSDIRIGDKVRANADSHKGNYFVGMIGIVTSTTTKSQLPYLKVTWNHNNKKTKSGWLKRQKTERVEHSFRVGDSVMANIGTKSKTSRRYQGGSFGKIQAMEMRCNGVYAKVKWNNEKQGWVNESKLFKQG